MMNQNQPGRNNPNPTTEKESTRPIPATETTEETAADIPPRRPDLQRGERRRPSSHPEEGDEPKEV